MDLYHGQMEGNPMNEERLRSIMSGLSRYELTSLEKRFVKLMEQNFKEERKLTGQQESILEGLYGVKTMFIKEAIFQSKATLKT